MEITLRRYPDVKETPSVLSPNYTLITKVEYYLNRKNGIPKESQNYNLIEPIYERDYKVQVIYHAP
jgi:hypothetical protein